MPRLRRHASRCHSTPTEPQTEPASLSDNIAAHSELAPEPDRQDHPISDDESGAPDHSSSSTEPDASIAHRLSNKYWMVDLKDKHGEIKQARLKVNDLFVLPKGKKVVMEWNTKGQPFRESGGSRSRFLGAVTGDFNNFPISYENWRRVPKHYKEQVRTDAVQDKFEVSDGAQKRYILENLGKKMEG